MYIVTPNYHDRRSPFRWMIRDSTQAPGTERAFKSVKAADVTFDRSPWYEAGFGCGTAAFCKTAEGSNEIVNTSFANLHRLRFFLSSFRDSERNRIKRCEELQLCSNGKIYGAVTARSGWTPERIVVAVAVALLILFVFSFR